MGFTPKDDWQGTYGTHPLSARVPICAGVPSSGRSYQLNAIIQDQRLVRCRRQAPIFMGAAEVFWTDAVESPAVIVDMLPFTTEEAFTGTLDVEVWAINCDGTGSVGVAVYASDATTLVDGATLQNSTPGVLESLTDTLTGLSASTDYHLYVALQDPGTNLAGVNYVAVYPRDLSTDV